MICDNHYEHCDQKWTTEECDSFHNDECPVCESEITPYSSTEYTDTGTKEHYHNTTDSKHHIFEVTLVGHSGSSEETDNLILWIAGDNVKSVASLLNPVSALITGTIGKTEFSANEISFKDGVDLKVGESTVEDTLNCVIGKYLPINDLYVLDYNLKSQDTADEVKRQCDKYITGIEDGSFNVSWQEAIPSSATVILKNSSYNKDSVLRGLNEGSLIFSKQDKSILEIGTKAIVARLKNIECRREDHNTNFNGM
jgi:hypothetical protein